MVQEYLDVGEHDQYLLSNADYWSEGDEFGANENEYITWNRDESYGGQDFENSGIHCTSEWRITQSYS